MPSHIRTPEGDFLRAVGETMLLVGRREGGWADALTDTLPCAASGWMRVRKRAQQSGAELPLVISDHADWPDLQRTILDTGAEEIWVTHGREEALVYFCETQGLRGRALALIGREGEGE